MDLSSLKIAFEHYQLDNGIQVIIAPDDTAQSVSVEYWVRMGSAHETSEQFGLCHFFEHVTPYGFLDQKEKNTKLRNLRVGSNAQTRKDFTRYYQEVKPEGLELLLEYTADRLSKQANDISAEKVAYERTRVLKEIARNARNPFWSAEGGMAINQAVFGEKHSYGHGAYGWVHLNEGFQLSDFREWFNRYYHLQNTAIFIVGKVEPKLVQPLIEKYFATLPTQPMPEGIAQRNLTSDTKKRRPKAQVLTTVASENYKCFLWQIPAWSSPEAPAFRVLSQIIDQRLQEQLAADTTIKKYSSSDLLNLYQHAGQFGMYIAYDDPSKGKQVEKSLKLVLRRLIKSGIDEEELAMGISKELANVKEMQEYLGFEWSRTALLGKGLLFKNDPNFSYQQLEKMVQLSTQELEKVIQEYLSKRYIEVQFNSAPR